MLKTGTINTVDVRNMQNYLTTMISSFGRQYSITIVSYIVMITKKVVDAKQTGFRFKGLKNLKSSKNNYIEILI